MGGFASRHLAFALLCSLAACGGSDSSTGDDGPDPMYPAEHPRIYLTPNRARLEASLAARRPAATRFEDQVKRWADGGDIWGFSAWNGALLSQLTGDQTYCTKAISEVDANVTEAEAAIAAGDEPAVAGDSYLEIGEVIGNLALVYDWCNSGVTSSQKTRWIAYANQAVWNVWNHQAATWGGKTFEWSGWSVDNPSNNYYYSFLRATMLLGLATKYENDQADAWIAKFRDEKIFGELVPTFDTDLVGGGSREGTGYGVAMHRLFELYDWWKATTGEILATKTTHTRASLIAFMHQIVPTLDKIAPTGDHSRDSTAAFFDYHRNYLLELMQTFPADDMSRRAKALLADSSVPEMENGFMLSYDFLNENPAIEPMPLAGINTAYHASGIGQIYARSSWDKDATWVNLTAGPYTESHAHQDQGALMIYKGTWLAHDANVHSHSGLAQDTTAHGLVRITSNGQTVEQVGSTTSTVLALHQSAKYLHVAADLTPAYDGKAAVQKVHREILYVLPDVVIVYDRVTTAANASQTWQLQVPVAPAISGATATISSDGHTLAVTKISGGTTSTYDDRADSDFEGGFRLDEAMPGGDNRYLHVLGIDGAVTSATADGENGVTVQLANGKTVKATFVRDSVGATLDLDGSSVTLGAGVDTLDE